MLNYKSVDLSRADVRVRNKGVEYIVRPVTEAAKVWLKKNAACESWQGFGGDGFALTEGCFERLARRLFRDGLVVHLEWNN